MVVGILFRGAVEDFLSGCKAILRADFSASRVGIIVLDEVSGVVNVDRLPIEELLCGWGYSNGRLVLLIWHVDVVGILLLLLLVVAIVVVVIVVILIVLVNVTLGDLLLDVHVGTAGVFDFNGRRISALIFYVVLVVLLLLEELLVVVPVIIVLVLLLILLVIEVLLLLLLLHLRV